MIESKSQDDIIKFKMSGHSKWSTIKHQKASEDQKRGRVFSKLAKAITVAVKERANGDPNTNAKLRLIMEQAKQANMPRDNIQRAIDRGLGKGEGAQLETVLYEGFGPDRVAVVIECVTDSRNRTTSEIKAFLERTGGSLGAPGSTNYLFEKKGLILIKKNQNLEEQMLKLMDLGIDDIDEGEKTIEAYTRANELDSLKDKIQTAGFSIEGLGLILKAKTVVPIEGDKREKIIQFLSGLDELEDVQKVYCNADFI